MITVLAHPTALTAAPRTQTAITRDSRRVRFAPATSMITVSARPTALTAAPRTQTAIIATLAPSLVRARGRYTVIAVASVEFAPAISTITFSARPTALTAAQRT